MGLISGLVNDIVKEHYVYISECERNSSEMAKNIAILKAKTKELQVNRELAESHFQHQMQERERLFSSASKVLDKAMKEGDVEYAQIAVKAIEVIHKKSPFSYEV
jgi:hypothetical protein